jgi:hypothetical protein
MIRFTKILVRALRNGYIKSGVNNMEYLKEQLIREASQSLGKELEEKRKARNKRKAARRKVRVKKRVK